MSKYLISTMIFLSSISAFTEEIKFNRDELARESVYPVFDHRATVKSRNVIKSKKIELGLFGGWAINDPFNSPLSYGALGTYHFDETHGVQILGALLTEGNSIYADQLQESGYQNFQFTPKPKNVFLASYEFTPFYGKMSFTKQGVLNLDFFTSAGVGFIGFDEKSYLAFTVGLGQRFYFSKKFGIRWELKGLFHKTPDLTTRKVTSEVPISEYDELMTFNVIAAIGFQFLL